jgi:hypothetical protein
MEDHRLKPMQDGYDEKLFNELYKQTAKLRRKLASQIDCRKFGVDYQEILSWFDVKFIHAFAKYEKKEPERLMGYIINSLSTYKYRIMRSSYQAKFHKHSSQIDITELYDYTNIVEEMDNHEEKEALVNEIMDYLKPRLSRDAILILEIELQPPPFILDQMRDMGKKENGQIPHKLIADYLGYDDSQNFLNYIKELRTEIKQNINLAKKFFANHNLPITQ